jgi:hypothetical protein
VAFPKSPDDGAIKIGISGHDHWARPYGVGAEEWHHNG